MKRLVLIFTVLIAFCSCCSPILRYKLATKNKQYYKEENTIENDSVFGLCQKVSFCPPIIDGGHVSHFCLTFLDTNAAKTKKVLHLETDTLIVKAKYDFWSVWFWGGYKYDKIKGTIKIVQWDAEKIILKENIKVVIDRRRNKKYTGKRTFYYKNE